MFKNLKNFMIGDALKNAKTIFDVSKLELMYNIIAIYIVIYIIGSIPAITGRYWVIIGGQIIGFAFIIGMAIALKSTKSIHLSRKIWFVSGIFFTLSSALLNNGEASFITYSFSIVNVVLSFLILRPLLRNIAVSYYIIFLSISMSISLGLVSKIKLPFDLSREHEFFEQPNIYAVIIALTMVAFIIDSYTKSYKYANAAVVEQKEKVILHKELLEKKNETIKLSIALAANIQAKSVQKMLAIEAYFSDHFYFHIPKEKLSGEFFWEKQIGDSMYFALVDTGEVGVPGAMYSYLVRNGLEKALKSKENPSPKSMLHYMNQFMNESLITANGLNSNIKVSLCQYSYLTNTLHLVGVSQPIVVQKNEILKTYFPKNNHLNYLNDHAEFDEVKIKLVENDLVYLFTDGISDGANTNTGKAIDYSNFKSILYNHLHNGFAEKSNGIRSHYESIKADGKQKDDITIIGLKI